MFEYLQHCFILNFWICCQGLLHTSQNESILAERAFLEARNLLREDEAKRNTHRKEEKNDKEEKNKENTQQEEKGTATLPQSPTDLEGGVHY